MSDCAAELRELSEPWLRGDKIKAAIGRAAKLAGLSYWRAFDIWYGKARDIRDFERQQIAAALEAKREQEARNELHSLRLKLEILEAKLNAKSSQHVGQAHAGDRVARSRRGVQDRPVAQGRML